jgi:hypothetical protein
MRNEIRRVARLEELVHPLPEEQGDEDGEGGEERPRAAVR